MFLLNLFEPIDHPLSNVGEQAWSILAPEHLEMKEIMAEIQKQSNCKFLPWASSWLGQIQIHNKYKNKNRQKKQIKIQIENFHLRSNPGKDKGGRVKHPLVCLAVRPTLLTCALVFGIWDSSIVYLVFADPRF